MVKLDFESEILDVESKLVELQNITDEGDMKIDDEIERLQKKLKRQLKKTYDNLDAWQKVQVARHTQRPQFLDYIDKMLDSYVELCGDRAFGNDNSILGGFGSFRGKSIVVLGQQKGHSTEDRVKHNFGMPYPEGYRKAKRIMEFANHFSLPLITFIDTSGAHPGVEAEERGQSQAIASCIECMVKMTVPVISIITGEGMSGGAIAIGCTNKILMLEHSIYTVISPEGCSSILWRTADKKKEAAKAQKLTAQDLIKIGIIDEIIKEPLGGAHRDHKKTIQSVSVLIEKYLEEFSHLTPYQLKKRRQEKFLAMGRQESMWNSLNF